MNLPSKYLLLGFGVAALALAGCDGGADGDLCADVTCGENASCDPDSGDCACDEGFSGDPQSGCTADSLCQADTCSGHGVCDDGSGMVVCACDTGYAGATCGECDEGYLDDPQNPGTCIPDPCGVGACTGHGACEVDATGQATCTCDVGYAGDACDTCDAGYIELPEGSGTCVEDPCLSVDCGDHGACAVDAGDAVCECDTGYTGGACDTCDAGYIEDPQNAGTCIEDPCAAVDCGANGTCVVDDLGSATCACDFGYAGELCDTCDAAGGYVESNANPGRCINDPCAGNDCSGHGSCVVTQQDFPVCQCETGYDGNLCELCAAGYAEFPAGSATCIVDPCEGFDCGTNGVCGLDDTGAAVCSCDVGYTGDGCTQCDAGYIEDPGNAGVCVEDPCLGVTCSFPDECNTAGDSLISYTGACVPLTGGNFECETTTTACDSGVCSAGACELLTPTPLPGDLALTELMIDPAGVTTPADGQWFEILNLAASELDLSGLVVDVGGTQTTFPAGVVLPVDGRLVVGPNGDTATNGGVTVDVVLTGLAALTTTTNYVDLFASDGTTQLDTVVWDDTWDHLSGRSLTLSPAATDPINENDLATSWCFAQNGTGTPGLGNDPCMVDWCNTQSPATLAVAATTASELVYGRVYEANLTEGDSQTPFIQAQLGFGADGVIPDDTWTWVDATYNTAFTAEPNNEEFEASLTFPAQGDYDYAYRMSRDGGLSWRLCDLNGSDTPYDVTQAGAATVAAPPPAALIFSEYVEGGSNNKAIELYNAGADLLLSRCAVNLYSNGGTTVGNTETLPAQVLPAGGTFVICNSGSVQAVLDVCDLTSTVTYFNGDDALELVCDGATLDVIGQIGNDPGSSWTGGGLATSNQTLRRACGITVGDADGSDAFDPSVEWDGFPQDTFDGLGAHSAVCVDPCDGVTCSGHGTCSSDTGSAVCTCDTGYLVDPADPTACIVDPCDGVTCSGNGTCSVDAGAAVCTCETGYTGADCAACDTGYVEYPAASGACIADPCTGVDCGNGTCGLDGTGAAVCTCAAGYTGAACDTCDSGYVEYPAGSGACIADPCTGVDCTGHGTCGLDGTGAAQCTCEAGYTGADCAQCDAAAGYVADPQNPGACIADPCAGVDCNLADQCNAAADSVVGYTGTCEVLGAGSYQCETQVTACASGSCNGGACVVVPAVGAGELAVTEIMIDSVGQWFELHNVSGAARDLAGIALMVDGTPVAFPAASLILPADGRLVVGPNADTATNGGVTVDVELPGIPVLTTLGGSVDIMAASGAVVIDSVIWDDTWNHYAGKSLTLSPASTSPIDENDVSASWCFAQGAAHSAGAANAPCEVDWCNTQSPASVSVEATVASEPVYGQVWESGFTDGDNPSPFILAQLGFGADGVAPDATWTWIDAGYNPGFSTTDNNEEFMASLVVPDAGLYDYAYRMSFDGGLSWKLCDLTVSGSDGSADGYDPANAGEATVAAAPVPELIFSEYVEGSSNNKALEIFNAGTAAVDLSACVVKVHTNGGTATNGYTLPGVVLDADATFVVCNASSDAALKAVCDLEATAATGFNGNDALELVCDGTTLDVIGQIGNSNDFAANMTLRRKCGITAGDADGSDAFDPSVEWDGFPQDTFDGLGAHSTVCVDPCDGVTCNTHGTCQPAGGSYTCACEAGYDASDDCLSCVAGYVADPSDGTLCIEDLCLADTCSGHGTCSMASAGTTDCACDAGYAGDACDVCDTGYGLVGGECLNQQTVQCDASATPTHATATLADVVIDYVEGSGWEPVPACAYACEAGYEGAQCDACASGFVTDPADATACIQDLCLADTCSGNGTCSMASAGSTQCTCDAGWAQPDCAACATDYDLVAGACVDTQQVPCDASGTPTHATADVVNVTITYTTAGGWTDAAACSYSCEAGYTGSACDACDAAAGYVSDPQNAGECIADPCAGVDCNQPAECNAAGDAVVSYTGTCEVLGSDSYQCTTQETACVSGICSGGACVSVPQALAGDVAITEVMIQPTGVAAAADGQWFEIVNLTAGDLDLGGVSLDVSGLAAFTFPTPFVVAAGDHVVIGGNDDAATNGGVTVDLALAGMPELTVAGEWLELFAADGTTSLDMVLWDDTWNHRAGYSLSLTGASTDPINENDAGSAWCFAQSDVHTAGAANDPCTVDWCTVQSPTSLPNVPVGFDTDWVYGQVYEAGLTDAGDETPFIIAELGYGADGVAPDATWSWTGAMYNSGVSGINNEEFMAYLTVPTAGAYDYAYRVSLDGGLSWKLCDANGSADGYAAADAGAVEILANDCDTLDCGTNGTCELDASYVGYCACDTGYTGAACDTCDAGYVESPLGSGTCVEDPCASTTCGTNEHCELDAQNLPACTCDAGYTGAACDTCDAGYVEYPAGSGTCVADLCDGVTCDANAHCEMTAADAQQCVCDADYDLFGGACVNSRQVACDASGTPANASAIVVDVTITYTDAGGWTDAAACAWACDSGYVVDPTDSSVCIADQCTVDTCSGHGTCSMIDGSTLQCDCDTGYIGGSCDACDAGYAEWPLGSGACELDPCDGVSCGNGACTQTAVDAYVCVCDAGSHLDLDSGMCVADVAIGWCNVQDPKSYTGSPNLPQVIYGQVWVNGVTDPAGQGTGVMGQLCSSAAPVQAATDIATLDCVPAVYNVDAGNNDEYMAPLVFDAAGDYEYVFAFSGDGGSTWTLCDADDTAAWAAGTATIESAFVNGSFEDWDAGVTMPDGWTADAGVGVAQESTTVYDGSYSVMLTRTLDTNGDTDFVSSPFPVTEAESYLVTMWYFDDSVDAKGTLAVLWLDASMTVVGSVYSNLYTTNQPDWQALAHTVTAPAGATFMQVFTRVYKDSGAATGGSIYLDDVSVVGVP